MMAGASGETNEDSKNRDLAGCPTLDAGAESLKEIDTGFDSKAIDREIALVSVLADETRYRILRLLMESEERCVCEFDAIFDVSTSAISHALSRLVEAGLVQRRKEGRWRVYSTTDRAERLLSAISTEADV
ncbi:MAG: ArsR/SmtB family transcription factor [Halodesulfurarchaeum sp.]